MRRIISLLMENEPGALSRVIGLFSQRGYNIETLNVAPTQDQSLSRLTLTTNGDDAKIEQIIKHLNRLIDVVKLVDLTDGEHIERELLLVKVRAVEGLKENILRCVDIFRAQVVDVQPDLYVIQLTGKVGKINAFMNALDSENIIETVRSGVSGIARGERNLSLTSL
jgi:acetolactate synthase I/III small subunit